MNQNTSVRAPAGGADAALNQPAILLKIERETTTTAYRAADGRAVPIPAPARWVIGAFVGVGAVIALTVLTNDRVESQLVDRTEQSLRGAGLDPSDYTIDFDFREGTVTGALPDGWSTTRFESVVGVDGASSLEFVQRQGSAAPEGDS